MQQIYVRAVDNKATIDVLHKIVQKQVAVENIIELPNPMKDRADFFALTLKCLEMTPPSVYWQVLSI